MSLKKDKATISALEVRRQLNSARVAQSQSLAKIDAAIRSLEDNGFTSDALVLAVKALRMIANAHDGANMVWIRGIARGALKKIKIDDLKMS